MVGDRLFAAGQDTLALIEAGPVYPGPPLAAFPLALPAGLPLGLALLHALWHILVVGLRLCGEHAVPIGGHYSDPDISASRVDAEDEPLRTGIHLVHQPDGEWVAADHTSLLAV